MSTFTILLLAEPVGDRFGTLHREKNDVINIRAFSEIRKSFPYISNRHLYFMRLRQTRRISRLKNLISLRNGMTDDDVLNAFRVTLCTFVCFRRRFLLARSSEKIHFS